ncbi:sensor histidine kinase [Roseateles sp.]|uniref:sensor histidine kinase n=1 Tax=Roseateles sp. TaxID=1971397 RepID=UPI003BA5D4C8
MAFIAFFALAATSIAAHAQPLPAVQGAASVVPKTVGVRGFAAELAVSNWSRADWEAWHKALRGLGSGALVPRPVGPLNEHLPAHLLPPDAPDAWSAVVLPDVAAAKPSLLPKASDAGEGASIPAEYQMRWYRLRALQDNSDARNLALYLPRLLSLPAAVLVRSDAGWLPVFDPQSGVQQQTGRPWLVSVPKDSTLGAQELEWVLAVPVQMQASYAVSTIWLGSYEDLKALQQRRWFVQTGIPQALGVTLLVLGLFAFSLWWRQRAEPVHLLFALLLGAWFLHNLQSYQDSPRTAAGQDWSDWMTQAAMSCVFLLMFLLASRSAGRRVPWFESAMTGSVLLLSVAGLPWWPRALSAPGLQALAQASVAGLLTLGVAVLVFQAYQARQSKTVEVAADRPRSVRDLAAVALSTLAAALLLLHDGLIAAGWAWPERIPLLPYAALISALSFLFILRRRYLGALQDLNLLKNDLSEQLLQQSQDLQAQHQRLREAERQQSLLTERQRLMQDMHDGLGSSLLSAMVAVEQGSMDQDKVVEVLRECVDDLRLVIDSLEPVAHDLVALLATMRYRLGKRLQAGGLMLEWDVQDLPMLEWLEPPDALHVLRLMQEALSNVLKHARATRVRMVTRNHGRYVEIRVEDDGDGFDLATAQRGRGLKSQQRRAQRLGGEVRIDSSPGHGTRLSLRLPVTRTATPGQQTAADSRTI